MARVHGLTFEVKGIQPAIAEGGRLRDLAGASDLIDRLCRPGGDDLLGEVIDALSIEKGRLFFARRAGAAFRVFSEDRPALLRLRAAWSLFVMSAFPGIEAPSALVEGDSQIALGEGMVRALDAARARPRVLLPVVGPFIRRSPRTGRPAVGRDLVTDELVDAMTRQKRKVTDKKEKAFREGGLVDRALPGWRESWLCWPTTFEPETDQIEFPLLPDNTHIAVVHADGNGFGQLLIDLHAALARRAVPDPGYADAFFAFSQAIAEATTTAARAAVEKLVPAARHADGVMPLRPILLGGDDLTVIVRGDLAIPFTRTFLGRFETETKKQLDDLRGRGDALAAWLSEVEGEQYKLPYLTAGAGIAFIKASQPFHLGLDLAEDLATFAKRVAKGLATKAPDPAGQPTPSVLAFHRVTTTLVDDYATLVEKELAVGNDRRLTLQPYALHPDQGLPAIGDLEALTLWLEGGGDKGGRLGRLREVAGLQGRDEDEAAHRYRRWRHVIDKREAGSSAKFDGLMAALGLRAEESGLHWQQAPPRLGSKRLERGSPIVDALSWAAVRAGGEG